MELISYFDLFLGALLNVIFYFIIVNKVFNIKTTNIKSKKIIVCIIISVALSIINIYNKNTFKAILAIPLVAIGIYQMYNISFPKSIYYTIVCSFYLLIGEVVISFVFSSLNIKLNFANTNILGKTLGNVLVIISTFPFLYIKFISNVFIKISNNNIKIKNIMTLFIIFLIVGSAFVFNGIMNMENIISNIVNIIIFSVFAVSLYTSYKKTEKVNKISDEYNSLLNYLDNYEKQLVEKRKLIHDFRNQLIVINGYIGENDKLREYLKEIIEEQKNIKETKIVKNIYKLPSGLKGLIYYKLSQINSEFKISLNVKSKFPGFTKLSAKDNRNILKIVGILLDNAIEAASKSNEKYINMDIYMKNGVFVFNIMNSYSSNIDKTKIMDVGFSTKGKNRGYGLSLVNDITKNDNRYNIIFDMSENEFNTVFNFNSKEK